MSDEIYIKAISDFIKSMKYSDVNWLKEMIKHHEDALMMSKMAIAHSSNDKVKSLAEKIITAQTAEITLMKGYIKDLE